MLFRSLGGQCALCDRPAVVLRADEVLDRHHDVVQEQLTEPRDAGGLADGTRLDARRVLAQAESIMRARLKLAVARTDSDHPTAEFSPRIADLRSELDKLEMAARELEKEEAKLRGALQEQNAQVEKCLAAALKAFSTQATQIKVVNRAFSNAGELRRLQLRAVAWERIWGNLDHEWQPIPGLIQIEDHKLRQLSKIRYCVYTNKEFF